MSVEKDVEEVKKMYLQMLDVRKGKDEEIERMLRFLLDKEEQAIKDVDVAGKELERRKKLLIMYRELIEEAKVRLKGKKIKNESVQV